MGLGLRSYTAFLKNWGALVGVPVDRISTELEASVRPLFNAAMRSIWESGPWLENTPRAEARFVGDKLSYPNDLTKASYWTLTSATATANSLVNPIDGRMTATKLMEAATTTFHRAAQTIDIVQNTSYTFSVYARPNGRSWIYLIFSDGINGNTAFFNISTGAVGAITGIGATSNIGQMASGYYLCQLSVTTSATANPTALVAISLSEDDDTFTYAGDITKGAYSWGALVQQTSNAGINDSLISWTQLGEEPIECLFDCLITNPMAVQYPQRQTYDLTPDGIQLISANWTQYYTNGIAQSSIYGSNPCNPVSLFYRRRVPNYDGDDFSTTATYAIDDQVYFEDSDGVGNFYKCIVATTAAQSPTATPASWLMLPIYDTFFNYVVYQAYGDWLISDGQMDKANGAYAIAQKRMDDQFDRLERQMGDVMPCKTQTHLTAQARVW